MTDRNSDRKWLFFVCGKCKHEVYYRKSEDRPECDECGAVYEGTTSSTSNTTTGGASEGGDLVEIREWMHGTRDVNDIPMRFRLDLANPNG